ncbi:hypothetical protein POP15_286 [Pectobacterium phage POP15]|nr:hypothetical protein POP15_286 [Pectobacterium phage POP15]
MVMEFLKIMVCVGVYLTAVCLLAAFIKSQCERKS